LCWRLSVFGCNAFAAPLAYVMRAASRAGFRDGLVDVSNFQFATIAPAPATGGYNRFF